MKNVLIKNLFLLSVFVVLPLLAKAQSLNYGFQIGMNYTDFRAERFYHPQLVFGGISPTLTYGFNTIVEYKPNKIGVSIEPGYILKTLSVTSKNIQERYLDAKLHFVNLPLMLVIDPSKNVRFFVGPELAYNFYTEIEQEEYQNPIVHKLELSISLGCQIRFKDKYGIGLKCSQGLTSLTAKEVEFSTSVFPNSSEIYNTRTKSAYFQLFFRYYI